MGEELELPGRAERESGRGKAVGACGCENGIVVYGPNGAGIVVCEEEGKLQVGRECGYSEKSSGCGDLIGELSRKQRNEIGFFLLSSIDGR